MTKREAHAVRVQIGIRLRKMREALHLNQAGLAEDMGLQRSLYGRIERGVEEYMIDGLLMALGFWGVDILSAFKKPNGPRLNPLAELALEQLREFLAENKDAERASHALLSISSWHAALPKKKP